MNYELTNFNSIFSSYTGESRRIKLRKLSFTNVYNAWKAISDSVIPSIPEQSDTKDSDDIVSEEETTTNDVNKIKAYGNSNGKRKRIKKIIRNGRKTCSKRYSARLYRSHFCKRKEFI